MTTGDGFDEGMTRRPRRSMEQNMGKHKKSKIDKKLKKLKKLKKEMKKMKKLKKAMKKAKGTKVDRSDVPLPTPAST